ncbi:MAG TPA: hypothetical protein VM284_04555 [Candidatus Limnocylindria bacterium]|nr:hypothetical protein [Candidatus Limnocylindria bacterium]
MVVDIGTGTGQAVLRRAKREPSTLVVGVDAEASAMGDASRKAAAHLKKGGLPNALFLAEGAERLPGQLAGRADLVTVVLPWGSLLRGILDGDEMMLAALTGLLNARGQLLLFMSDIDRHDADTLTERLAGRGLRSIELRPAAESDVVSLSSGWARRLGIPGSRPAWIIRMEAVNAHSIDRAQHRG